MVELVVDDVFSEIGPEFEVSFFWSALCQDPNCPVFCSVFHDPNAAISLGSLRNASRSCQELELWLSDHPDLSPGTSPAKSYPIIINVGWQWLAPNYLINIRNIH